MFVSRAPGGSPISWSYLRTLGIDETLGFTAPEGDFFLMADGLGSTSAVSGLTGNLVTEYNYDAFGATSATNATGANPFQFTGRENDGLAGLYYYRARYHHPGLQRGFWPCFGRELNPTSPSSTQNEGSKARP